MSFDVGIAIVLIALLWASMLIFLFVFWPYVVAATTAAVIIAWVIALTDKVRGKTK